MRHITKTDKKISAKELHKITQIAIKTGQMLLHYGAESTVVIDLTQRIGYALGAETVDISLSPSSMVFTLVYQDIFITITRRCPKRGVNMTVIAEVQKICIMAERKKLDIDATYKSLVDIKPKAYNRYLVVMMVGLSCAAFSRIAGGEWSIFGLTFVAASIGVFVRQELVRFHFNVLLCYVVTAFVVTCISAVGMVFAWGHAPFIAVASAILFLMPGYPLINSISDFLKGFVTMGIGRFTMATLLIVVTSVGVVAALSLWGVWN